jgi:hypothetical protein
LGAPGRTIPCAKYPALTGARGAPHWYAARVASAGEVLAVQRRLAELAA